MKDNYIMHIAMDQTEGRDFLCSKLQSSTIRPSIVGIRDLKTLLLYIQKLGMFRKATDVNSPFITKRYVMDYYTIIDMKVSM